MAIRLTADGRRRKPPTCSLPATRPRRRWPWRREAFVRLHLMQQHFEWAVTPRHKKGPGRVCLCLQTGICCGERKRVLHLHRSLPWYDLTWVRHNLPYIWGWIIETEQIVFWLHVKHSGLAYKNINRNTDNNSFRLRTRSFSRCIWENSDLNCKWSQLLCKVMAQLFTSVLSLVLALFSVLSW